MSSRLFKAAAGAAVLILAVQPLAVPAAGQDRLAPVDVVEVREAPIVRPVSLSGSVTSPRRAELSTAIAGLVQALHVEIGDRVAAGDLLLQLDRDLERLTLEQAQAAVREAEADLAEASRRLDVGRRLLERRSLPENEVDTRAALVRMARHRLARLEAEAAYEAGRLDRHDLRAPFAGVIAERRAELGEWVEPGDGLMHLVAVDGLLVDAPVPQDVMPRIGPGSTVTARFDALPDRAVPARIRTLVPVSDPRSRSAVLRVVPDLPPGMAVMPGMSATLDLRLQTGATGSVVPRDALLRHPDGRVTLWVVEQPEGGQAAIVGERRVRTGLQFDGLVELREGPPPGTRIVLRGNEGLRPGQKVQVRDAGQAPATEAAPEPLSGSSGPPAGG